MKKQISFFVISLYFFSACNTDTKKTVDFEKFACSPNRKVYFCGRDENENNIKITDNYFVDFTGNFKGGWIFKNTDFSGNINYMIISKTYGRKNFSTFDDAANFILNYLPLDDESSNIIQRDGHLLDTFVNISEWFSACNSAAAQPEPQQNVESPAEILNKNIAHLLDSVRQKQKDSTNKVDEKQTATLYKRHMKTYLGMYIGSEGGDCTWIIFLKKQNDYIIGYDKSGCNLSDSNFFKNIEIDSVSGNLSYYIDTIIYRGRLIKNIEANNYDLGLRYHGYDETVFTNNNAK